MKSILVIMMSLLLVGCASHKKGLKPEKDVAITKTLKGHRYGNIYFSGQPDGKEIRELSDNGFQTVINLRDKTEGKYQEYWEEGAVKNNDLNYYNLPYDVNDPLTKKYVDEVTEKVLKHRGDGKILIHCGSGNRAALWAGAHFAKDHGLTKEKARQLAKDVGMTSQRLEAKLDTFVDKL